MNESKLKEHEELIAKMIQSLPKVDSRFKAKGKKMHNGRNVFEFRIDGIPYFIMLGG